MSRLRLSFRSKLLRPGKYLRPDGTFGGAAHFFEVSQLDEGKLSRYRLGPENPGLSALASDFVEIASDDGEIVRTLFWPKLSKAPAVMPPPRLDSARSAPSFGPRSYAGRVGLSNGWIFALSALASFGFITLVTSAMLCSPFSVFCEAEPGGFQLAVGCAETKMTTSPCEARQCFDAFLATAASAPEADRRGATLMARNLEEACTRRSDDEEAERTRECFASAPPACPPARTCLDGYIEKFPGGAYRQEFERAFDALQQKCEAPKPIEATGAPAASAVTTEGGKAEDDRAFAAAKACANAADAAAKRACYEAYLAGFDAGAHVKEAKDALDALKTPPSAAPVQVSDGIYKGYAVRGCNEERGVAFSVFVQNRALNWEHSIGAATYSWVGVVGPDGSLTARAKDRPETNASGRFFDEGAKEFEMHYPECEAPIKVRFYGTRPQ